MQYLHDLPFSYPVLWARDGCSTLVARDRFQSLDGSPRAGPDIFAKHGGSRAASCWHVYF
jgi:hypothetical protein